MAADSSTCVYKWETQNTSMKALFMLCPLMFVMLRKLLLRTRNVLVDLVVELSVFEGTERSGFNYEQCLIC